MVRVFVNDKCSAESRTIANSSFVQLFMQGTLWVCSRYPTKQQWLFRFGIFCPIHRIPVDTVNYMMLKWAIKILNYSFQRAECFIRVACKSTQRVALLLTRKSKACLHIMKLHFKCRSLYRKTLYGIRVLDNSFASESMYSALNLVYEARLCWSLGSGREKM